MNGFVFRCGHFQRQQWVYYVTASWVPYHKHYTIRSFPLCGVNVGGGEGILLIVGIFQAAETNPVPFRLDAGIAAVCVEGKQDRMVPPPERINRPPVADTLSDQCSAKHAKTLRNPENQADERRAPGGA